MSDSLILSFCWICVGWEHSKNDVIYGVSTLWTPRLRSAYTQFLKSWYSIWLLVYKCRFGKVYEILWINFIFFVKYFTYPNRCFSYVLSVFLTFYLFFLRFSCFSYVLSVFLTFYLFFLRVICISYVFICCCAWR